MWQANEDGLLTVSARTLKCIADHALDYHEKYIHPDLEDLAEKFTKVKKLRVQEFARSLDPSHYAALLERLQQINVRRAASDYILSTITIPRVCLSGLNF